MAISDVTEEPVPLAKPDDFNVIDRFEFEDARGHRISLSVHGRRLLRERLWRTGVALTAACRWLYEQLTHVYHGVEKYICCCAQNEVRTRHTWTVIMVCLGTLYMLINVWNVVQLWDDNLKYELVVGPPMFIMKLLIAVFTCTGTIIWFLELINTLSVYCHGGYTLVSITVEMLFTISLVHIPIAALNYFTAQCRANHTSMLQILSGGCSIAYIFIRMIWFAHLQGHKIKQNDKRELKQGLFMLTCALFSCAMAFQIMSWRGAPSSVLTEENTNNVSIIFLKADFKHNEQVAKRNATLSFKKQGHIMHKPYLLKSMTQIVHAGSQGMVAYFACNYGNLLDNQTLTVPYLCDETVDGAPVTAIKFRVLYERGNDMLPFGEIHFNYAQLTAVNFSLATGGKPILWDSGENLNALYNAIEFIEENKKVQSSQRTHEMYEMIDKEHEEEAKLEIKASQEVKTSESRQWVSGLDFYGNVTEGTCNEGKTSLKDGWNLWFLTTAVKVSSTRTSVFIESPWISSCTTPYPRYDASVAVC